ncbi:hypothetical protein VitviT2T_023298 [Vitis vinifera]|uniref:CCHC-type domain-containing protein n=1 Tax=Vitis vinifera TaxID=29760 RepID=A0ABY9DF04_VITVI|nr:hypothetical protein VitviT2T_023298 [Vitis vinifera]
MNILLINENYHFVLKEDCPPVPPANASKAVSEEYNRWIIANNKACSYLLAAMNEVLRTKHEGLETASEIMESLQQMFGRPSEQARHEAVKAVMNSKMKNGSSVCEHVLKLIHHFNEVEINGAKIDEKTQVGMILETLSPSFLQFRTNYIMNHKKYNLTELLNELQSYETLIDDKGGKTNIAEANAVVGKASSSRNKKKRNVRNQKDKKKIQKKKRKAVEPKPKRKCFHCNQDGHWKMNCKKYLDELKQKKKQGASNHVFISLKMLESSKDLEEGAFMMRVGSGARVSATAVGTVRLDDDPLTFKMAMDDVDREKWQEAMKLEIESMYSNSVWELIDLLEGIKPIGCKWIYKRKRRPNGKVETFKARLVAKGFTQKEGVDYEDTFSPVAMLKSIRILLSIAAYYDYEIWKMDVKTTFLNGHLEKTIYMVQPEGFVVKDQEQKVCKLQRSIYGLKQASRSWNIRFNEAIKSYGFEQNLGEPCVYKQIGGDKVVFLVLYVDDILLIGNDVESLSKAKNWLASQFQMKDLGEASYILGIQMTRDRKNRLLALSQAAYIDKVLVKFAIENSKKGNLPSRHGVHLSKEQCPKTPQDEEKMRRVPYASAVGSLMYAMLCTRPDICFAVGVVSRYQSNPGLDHWVAVKHILKYLRRTRNYMLVYSGRELIPIEYTDSDFQSDRDSRKSTSGAVFTLGGGAIKWRSVKQTCVADSTMEAEYVAACETAKKAVWLCEFLKELEVVPNMHEPIKLYCDNSGAVANAKEPRNHRKGKHIERKFHLVREIVSRGDVSVEKIASANNIADPFTKTLPARSFEQHLEGIGLRDMSHLL